MILPFVRELFLELEKSPAFRELLGAVAHAAGRACAAGLTATARALYTALLARASGRPVLVLAADNKAAESFLDLLGAFHELVSPGARPPVLLPAHDLLPYDGLSPHPDISEKRAIALWKMARSRAAGPPPLVVAPVGAVVMRLEQPEFYACLGVTIRRGGAQEMDTFVSHLETVGYQRREPVEMVGQFSVRGGILDVFSPEAASPVRLEWFGDQVESIREFDVNSQRSVAPREETTVLPLIDFPLRPETLRELEKLVPGAGLDSGQPFPGWEFLVPLVRPLEATVFDLLSDPLVVLDEPEAIRAELDHLWQRLVGADPRVRPAADLSVRPAPLPEQLYLRPEELDSLLAARRRVEIEELAIEGDSVGGPSTVVFHSQPTTRFHGNIPLMVEELRRRIQEGFRVMFLAPTTGDVERLADILGEYGLSYQVGLRKLPKGIDGYLEEKAYISTIITTVVIIKGAADQGVAFPNDRLALFSYQDLFDVSEVVARPRKVQAVSHLSTFLGDFRDLEIGDYVVHVEHGIGRYQGLKQLAMDADGSQPGEFMMLEYAEGARLYVPLARLDLVQKYQSLGDNGPPPRLDKLGGITWARTRARVRKSIEEMAGELLKLYAERKVAGGHGFGPDTHWQREFEDTFEYQETPDQATAIADLKKDMESSEPMDRLLCGDVGYGKTEVAMRASIKAVADNKQVAVLAPTTVLAFQHSETFRQRFAPFPVRVEMLSRFRRPAEQKAVLRDLELGKVDVIIGTHRLLSKDVVFRDLGLLVVDEEQRFGVRHKERIKQMRKQVDVLTLSATPIPRTLHMSLVGLRDMSVIETPPKDRLAIQTVVAPFSENLIRTAIEQELARGGQVYFVHNRVETIYSMAALAQKLVPKARLAVGHGQMNERKLEKVMLGLVRHEYDILISTTIIENGLDIPLCNTIIVNRADRFGLSELYQLRGRVGRSNRRAYAYLLVPEDREMTPLARKRLSILKEFSELGSGFKVAALDLELRGAGNLLGRQQHGHIQAVGFDFYCQMLERTVRELKGEEVPPEVSTTISLGLDLRIPQGYISEEGQRLRVYKRIAGISGEEERTVVEQELEDRYGPVPPQILHLLDYAVLKSRAMRLAIQSIDRSRGAVSLKFHENAAVDPARLMDFVARRPGAQFSPTGVLRFPVEDHSGAGILLELKSLLQQLQAPL